MAERKHVSKWEERMEVWEATCRASLFHSLVSLRNPSLDNVWWQRRAIRLSSLSLSLLLEFLNPD